MPNEHGDASVKSWFRKYWNWMNDPNIQMMDEKDQRRLDMLYCLRCSGYTDPPDDVVVSTLRISPEEWQRSKALFIEKGFIDESNRLRDWTERKSDSSAQRVRKHREKKQSQKEDVTLPERFSNEPVTEQDTETEKIEIEDGEESFTLTGGGNQPDDRIAAMPKASKGEAPEQYHRRYMAWVREKIARLIDTNRGTWEIAYPAVNIKSECARAVAWMEANSCKRKKDVPRFVTNWLAKAQEKGHTPARNGPPPLTWNQQKQNLTVNSVNSLLEEFGNYDA